MGNFKREKIDIVKEELKQYLNNKDKINKLCNIYYNLTNKGFEIYIAEFFRNVLKYNIKIRWWLKDWWIDIEATKNINWKEQKVFIQCKQRHWASKKWHINKKEISSFLWNIQKEKTENTILYLITTSWLTQEAKKFAKENNIKIKDYKDIIDIYDKFTFEEFEKVIKFWKYNYTNKIFEDEFSEISNKKKNEIKETIKTTKNDIEELLEKINKNNENKNCNFSYKTNKNKNYYENKTIKFNWKKEEIKYVIIVTIIIVSLSIYYFILWQEYQKELNIKTKQEINQEVKQEYQIIKNNKKNIKK